MERIAEGIAPAPTSAHQEVKPDPRSHLHSNLMRRTGFGALVFLSLGVVGYAIAVYALLPLGAATHPDMRATFESHHRLAFYAHVFGSAFALALGPFQFWARLRASRPALHRWSGRLYLGVGVLVGGMGGLVVAFNAFGGPFARAGFACLAALWLFSGFRAYQAIRSRDIVAHRRWMVRNFALTFAAVSLRLWLPGMVISGVSFHVAYAAVAWLCWVPNAIIAEALFNRKGALRM
jgi:uncharacterized membrane protein